MPAELLGDPAGIACAFSDGRRSRHVVVTPDPLPLVRDLLTGLAGLVHPHGPVDAPGTVTDYLAGVRDLAGFLRARGAGGGAGALTRVLLAEYWMQAGWRHESATRRMLAAADAATGVLRPEVRALVAGRHFAAMPVTAPLQPYTEQEWERLHRVCRQVADEAFGRYRAARAGAAGGDDPRAAQWDAGNLRWLLTRLGPAAMVRQPPGWAGTVPGSPPVAGSGQRAKSCIRPWK